jgi:hypothetical protein
MMGLFVVFTAGQILTGAAEYNNEQRRHGEPEVSVAGYLQKGHPWEALFENWESEFLQMAAFVLFTTVLYQRGSPESRRPGVTELYDADPRRFRDQPNVPWPVKKGGVVLWLYERSLGSALMLLFLLSVIGHAVGGWRAELEDAIAHGGAPLALSDYVRSATFWFESFQNWQSEFLSIAAMVWLSVYLRQRGSPESKAVHAPHHEAE